MPKPLTPPFDQRKKNQVYLLHLCLFGKELPGIIKNYESN
jgi:hypothetical protein